METYNDFFNKAIAVAIPTAAPVADRMQYYGQVGDFFGGVWGTIIGVVTLLVVFATWYSTRRIDSRSKIYQVFAEILRTHEEIVTSLRLGDLVGRDAISAILSEFYAAYAEIKKSEKSGALKLDVQTRINAAFLLMYYGAHPETVSLLEAAAPGIGGKKICDLITKRKKSNISNVIRSKLSAQLDGDPAERDLWHQSIRQAFDLVDSLDIANESKRFLRGVLMKAQTRPHKILNKHRLVEYIESYALSTEFGGHQNRLSHYFRNLHSAFTFIAEQKLTKKEKHSLSKVLRSKLSTYEQALLALNSLTVQGSSWINSGLIDKYMPIKNIPEHFFSFDEDFKLKEQFGRVNFEWEMHRLASRRARGAAWVSGLFRGFF